MKRAAGRVLALELAALALAALALHAPDFTVTDMDGYYHLRHAWLYGTLGPWLHEFPWVECSAIHDQGADLWYGFHVLLIPLTWLSDLVLALRAGAVAVTLASLLAVHAAVRRLDAAWPIVWTLLFAFGSADLSFRLTMLRPHPLSLGLCLWLFALLAGPRPARWPALLAVSALLAWIHLALAWIPGLVLAAASAERLARERRWPDPAQALAVAGGTALGALARPNPAGALRLAWIQVVEVQRAKSQGALQVGHELVPLDLGTFAGQLSPLLILLLAGAALIWGCGRAERRAARWSGFALALAFLALACASARRATELFIGFAVLSLAGAVTAGRRLAPRALPALAAAAVALLALRAWPVAREYRRFVAQPFAFAPECMRGAATWLAAHAAPDEVALNVHWDRFAQLFFWNPRNRYVNGMDPIFEYAHDPRLCLAHELLAHDAAEGIATDLRAVVRRGFGASYVVTERSRTPRLVERLAHEPGFEPVFDGGDEVVFRVR